MKITSIMSSLAIMLAVGSTKASLLNIDQIIFQNGTGQDPLLMSGTLDATLNAAGTQLTLVLTNTSANGAFTDSTAPASMLLTHVGFQLPTIPTNIDILSGSATVTAGSTALNFGGHNTTNISDEWGFANQSFNGFSLGLPINTGLSSVQNGQLTLFSGSGSINGPGFGALSANETQFGSSQPGVQNSITFVLNLSGAVTLAALNAGNVVLGFGSPNTAGGVPGVPDGGSTVALLGFTLLGVEILRRKVGRNSPSLS